MIKVSVYKDGKIEVGHMFNNVCCAYWYIVGYVEGQDSLLFRDENDFAKIIEQVGTFKAVASRFTLYAFDVDRFIEDTLNEEISML